VRKYLDIRARAFYSRVVDGANCYVDGVSGAACLLERISEPRAVDAEDLGGMKHAMLWREESRAKKSSEDSASL